MSREFWFGVLFALFLAWLLTRPQPAPGGRNAKILTPVFRREESA